ncbi:hypothetical protein SB757_31755, partial [Pseudomonas sp. SIMBA_065]
AILKGLGWKLVRLWSTEWWIDKSGALDRLHASLETLLSESRAVPAIAQSQDLPVPHLVLVQPLSAVSTADQADTIVSPSTQDQF